MKIANADKLKQHFENVVDVKLFTVPNILTIIDTFSSEIEEGHEYKFHKDGDDIIVMEDLNKKDGQWLYPYADHVIGGRKVGKSTKECSVCSMQFENNLPWNAKYCPNCGSHNVGGTEP